MPLSALPVCNYIDPALMRRCHPGRIQKPAETGARTALSARRRADARKHADTAVRAPFLKIGAAV